MSPSLTNRIQATSRTPFSIMESAEGLLLEPRRTQIREFAGESPRLIH
jgi:hypothetical protein